MRSMRSRESTVGLERQDGRLLRSQLACDRALDAHSVVGQRDEDVASASSPISESKNTIARFISGSTSMAVMVTSASRSSSMRVSSSAITSCSEVLSRAVRG
jgi:hypothetical protein